MSIPSTFLGLACGTMLTAVGLGLWGSHRQLPGLSHAVWAIRWLAWAFLLTGVLLAWRGDQSLSAPASRLVLMAVVAAPPGVHHRRRSAWSSVMLILPALVLAGAALFWLLGSIGVGAGSPPAGSVGLAVIICGGLGARALGEVLSDAVAPTTEWSIQSKVGWSFIATYTLLTLLTGGAALMNLWQRGLVWGGAINEGGLAGAWLTWCAVWLCPRQTRGLRAALTGVAALLLASAVLK